MILFYARKLEKKNMNSRLKSFQAELFKSRKQWKSLKKLGISRRQGVRKAL